LNHLCPKQQEFSYKPFEQKLRSLEAGLLGGFAKQNKEAWQQQTPTTNASRQHFKYLSLKKSDKHCYIYRISKF